MKSRRLAVYGLTAGLLGGGGAGLLMTGTTLAGAQTEVSDPAAPTDSTAADSGSFTTDSTAADSGSFTTDSTAADSGSSTTDSTAADSGSSTTTAPESSTSPSAPGAGDPGTTTAPAPPAPAAGSAKPAKSDWAKTTLDGLVADGTITQAQADKVLAALEAGRPAKGRGPGHGPGRGGFGRLDAAASVLGMSAAELRTALQGGKSLAAIAGEKGIDVAKVVDALAAQMKAHLDEHVASGKNTRAEADRRLAAARARIEAFVNGTAPAGGPGHGFGPGSRHGRGPKGGMPAPGTAPSSGSSSSGTITS